MLPLSETEDENIEVESLTPKEQRAALKLRVAQIDVDIATLQKEKTQIRSLLANK